MIEQNATVVRREGETAWVDTRPQSACGGCAVQDGCGTGVWVRWFGARRGLLPAQDPLGTRPGDEVVIGVPEGTFLLGSLLLYLLPLAGLLAGAALAAAWWGGSDGPAVAGALAGLGAGLWGARRAAARRAGWVRPRVLRRADKGLRV